MENVIDVAVCILNNTGSISTMKLQKLVYYSQAYCLVTTNEELFSDEIQAWVNGSVVHNLFNVHRGRYVVDASDFPNGDAARISERHKAVIAHVCSRAGKLTGDELSQLTHSEKPWVDARRELPANVRCGSVITSRAIKDYYSSPECTNAIFR